MQTLPSWMKSYGPMRQTSTSAVRSTGLTAATGARRTLTSPQRFPCILRRWSSGVEYGVEACSVHISSKKTWQERATWPCWPTGCFLNFRRWTRSIIKDCSSCRMEHLRTGLVQFAIGLTSRLVSAGSGVVGLCPGHRGRLTLHRWTFGFGGIWSGESTLAITSTPSKISKRRSSVVWLRYRTRWESQLCRAFATD